MYNYQYLQLFCIVVKQIVSMNYSKSAGNCFGHSTVAHLCAVMAENDTC